MTAQQFVNWLFEMKAFKLARSDKECASLLGVHVNTLINYKVNGASVTVALACRALLHRMTPYP